MNNIRMTNKLIVIFGPTSSGKTDLALRIAKFMWGRLKIESECINADSRQVYKGMDIGTNKLDSQTRSKFVHHFLDILSLDQELDVDEYAKNVHEKIADIVERKRIPILVGGTGSLIMKIVGDQILKNPKRRENTFHYNILLLIPYFERRSLYKKIEKNVDKMFDQGLYNEIKSLYSEKSESILSKTIGYKEFLEYCNKQNVSLQKLAHNDLKRIAWMIKRDTKKYAMHQIGWLKKIEKFIRVKHFEKIKDRLIQFVTS